MISVCWISHNYRPVGIFEAHDSDTRLPSQ